MGVGESSLSAGEVKSEEKCLTHTLKGKEEEMLAPIVDKFYVRYCFMPIYITER